MGIRALIGAARICWSARTTRAIPPLSRPSNPAITWSDQALLSLCDALWFLDGRAHEPLHLLQCFESLIEAGAKWMVHPPPCQLTSLRAARFSRHRVVCCVQPRRKNFLHSLCHKSTLELVKASTHLHHLLLTGLPYPSIANHLRDVFLCLQHAARDGVCGPGCQSRQAALPPSR